MDEQQVKLSAIAKYAFKAQNTDEVRMETDE